MPQSLAKIYIHIVFSTKHRQPFINEKVRDKLHAYIVGVSANLGSYTEQIFANSDHIHILCTMPRVISIAELISKIKTSSSKWMKQEGIYDFAWQDGYGVFSISSTHVERVKNYIINQESHHNKQSFQDELREALKEFHIEFDERYVWD